MPEGGMTPRSGRGAVTRAALTRTPTIGEELDKAVPPALQARAGRGNQPTATPMSTLINQMTQTPSVGSIDPLPRDPLDLNPFGPLVPNRAQPIDPNRRDSGRPEPRLSEYEVGWNIPGSGQRRIPWRVLREAARDVDVLRRCIQIRKGHVTGLKWSWTLSDSAVERAMMEQASTSRLDVESKLRQQMSSEIARLTAFWERPWRANNMTFRQWVSLALEEILSIDALAIYPRCNLGGDVLDLEILDGSTIKPLRDWRGALPQPPFPAYQQELYGFPRGEFTATVLDTPNGQIVPGAFFSDQMYYYRSVPFANTPYGMSQVEQALVSARLYLMRQGWMLAEYDDGVMPMTWLVPDKDVASLGNEPFTAQRRTEWQQAINDELAGNTRARQRAIVSPPGFVPHEPASIDSKYRPDYDQHLITLLASHLDITMAELGFSMTGGLGATGFHEGQEDVQFRKATLPTCEMLQEIIMEISRKFLGAPTDLVFKFLGLDSEDEAAADAVALSRVQSGRTTLNEERDRMGLPRYAFPEADMPQLQNKSGIVFIEGASETAPPGVLIQPPKAPPGFNANTQPTEPPETAAQAVEDDKPDAPANAEKGTRSDVRKLMRENFPPKALEWLDDAQWSGPHQVPLDDLDFDDEESWSAYKDHDRVLELASKIRSHENTKPVVLVHTPGSDTMKIIDGHHHVLAYRALGADTVPAFVGTVPSVNGPWNQTHSYQDRPVPAASDEAKAEIAAYHKWVKKSGGAPRRPFEFHALTIREALEREVVSPEDIGVTTTFAALQT